MPDFKLTDILKMLGPAYGALIAAFIGLGQFMLEMYKVNVANKIVNSFPSQFQISLYYMVFLFSAVVMMCVITYQTMAFKSDINQSGAGTAPRTNQTGGNRQRDISK
ncbi:hypothetical protein ACQKLN_31325 [Paenibacillus glucanolyticus]|uniref:hypothetical protein n=1 Tax=Paenibacillus glucanolyticus TaxID=59843 RepID=UPI003D027D3B